MILLLENSGQTDTATELKLILGENAVEVTRPESAQAQHGERVVVGVVLRGTISIEQIEAVRMGYPNLPIYVPFTGSGIFVSERYGRIYLDHEYLVIGQRKIHCGRKEALILNLLIAAGGDLVSNATILTELGYVTSSQTHTHLTHIGRIRAKLGDFGITNLVVTKRGKRDGGHYLNSE